MEGYRFFSLALLHTTDCLKESRRDTWSLWAGGCEDRQTVRAKKRKAGRQREGGRERDKTRNEGGLVASCSCLVVRSQIVINSTYCWITVRGKLHRNQSDDQKITVRLTFLQSEKRKHAQPLLLWDAFFGFPALVFICLYVSPVSVLFPSPFHMFCVTRCTLKQGASYGGARRKI